MTLSESLLCHEGETGKGDMGKGETGKGETGKGETGCARWDQKADVATTEPRPPSGWDSDVVPVLPGLRVVKSFFWMRPPKKKKTKKICRLRAHLYRLKLSHTDRLPVVWNRPTDPRACSTVLPPVPRCKDTALAPRSYADRKAVGLQIRSGKDHRHFFQYAQLQI